MRRLIGLIFILHALSAAAWAQWNQDAQDCFENTKPETMNADKALPYCERAIKSGQLTQRNLGNMFYYRGTIYTQKRDHKRAIADYTEAVKNDPTLPQAYNSRGFARFYLGEFQPAVADFTDALGLRPDDLYAWLWRYIAQARSGIDGKEELQRIVKKAQIEEWPAPVFTMYLGETTPQGLVNAATDADPKRQRAQKCEAYFYAGEQLLIQGKKSEAVKMFRAAVATNVTKFVEHEAAKVELKRLGG